MGLISDRSSCRVTKRPPALSPALAPAGQLEAGVSGRSITRGEPLVALASAVPGAPGDVGGMASDECLQPCFVLQEKPT